MKRKATPLITTIVAVGLSVLAASAAGSSFASRLHSIGPAEGYPGAAAVWVYFDYPMSVDCSPPRACYAKSQWIHAYVHCYTRTVAVMQQVSMDLNGNVVAVATAEAPQFQRGYGHRIRTYVAGPAGRVLRSVCGDLPEPD